MTVYRPELHVTAERGILEGPAGVFRSGDEDSRVWHMFYQYRPTPDAPSRWGHEMSEDDPFSWLDCSDVIAPAGGETNVRAGSVTASGDGVDLYFSSETAAGNTVQIAHVAHVDELCGDDEDDDLAAAERVGAVVEVVAEGVPPGLGTPIYGKLDGELAAAMMSINAVKGVEIGDGFASVAQKAWLQPCVIATQAGSTAPP